MLAKTKKGTEVSVDFMPDCGVNEGGLYCTITLYNSEDGEIIGDTFDDFCIYAEDCPQQGCWAQGGGPTEEAELFARDYVGSICDY